MIWKYWEKDTWYKRFAWFPKKLYFYTNSNPRHPHWFYPSGSCWVWLTYYYINITRQNRDNWNTITQYSAENPYDT